MVKYNKKNNGNFAQNSKPQSLKKSQAKAKRPKEKQYVIEETLEMRLDSCIQKVKDLSELIIGYTPYTLNFVVSNYSGTTNKPSKVSAFANAVVGIILADGQSSFSHIGSILGLNVDIDLAERKMLENAIKQMLDIHLLEGGESAYNVTELGKTFAEHGEKMEPYPSNFSLWYLTNHKSYVNLQNDLNEDFVNDCDYSEGQELPNSELTLDEIKALAEVQANHAHSSKDRYLLQEARKADTSYKSYNLIACFIRSVRTKEVRVLIYDDNSRKVLTELSAVIDSDETIKKSLYESMLGCTPDVEVLEEKDVVISEEQKHAEEDLLRAEETSKQDADKADNSEECSLEKRLHKRALYDSLSFETEIHTIFQQDNADEIWLSSPWVGDDAFMQSRLPLIQEFVKKGGCVFISYSEGANGLDSKKQMIGWQSNKAIQQMAKNYPGQFFYTQLEAFHSKNVLEVKNGQCILFTGSFNVLSFHVIPSQQSHIRKEEMALAHYQVAENKYKEFKKRFALSYIKRALDSFDSLSDAQILNYKNESLDFFRKDNELASLFADFDEKLDEIRFRIKNREFTDKAKGKKIILENEVPDEEQRDAVNDKTHNTEKSVIKMLKIAKRHIEAELTDENAIFCKLASLCYVSIGDNEQKIDLQVPLKDELLSFLLRNDVQKVAQFNAFKGKIEGTIQVVVLMKEYIFNFYNLTLSKEEFFSLFNKRSKFNYRNFTVTRPVNLVNIILKKF
jgi:hypothetical protein